MAPKAKSGRASTGKASTTPSAKKAALGSAKTISAPRTSTTPKSATNKKASATVAGGDGAPVPPATVDLCNTAPLTAAVDADLAPALAQGQDIDSVNYTLRISLERSAPEGPAWRVLSVPTGITFKQLHQVIQLSYDWPGKHHYEFRLGDRKNSFDPSTTSLSIQNFRGGVMWCPMKQPYNTKLAEVFEDSEYKGRAMKYIYETRPIAYMAQSEDDEWIHELLVEGYGEKTERPICKDGAWYALEENPMDDPEWNLEEVNERLDKANIVAKPRMYLTLIFTEAARKAAEPAGANNDSNDVGGDSESEDERGIDPADDLTIAWAKLPKLTTPKSITRTNYTMQIQLMPGWVADPAIWREFSVPTTITFAHLQKAITIAFGWGGGHAWAFSMQPNPEIATGSAARELHMGATDMEGFEGLDQRKPGKVKLHEVFEDPKFKDGVMMYEYDFGDGWEHFIKIVGYEKRTKTIVCKDGKGHGIPDDVGGPPGWEALKDAYRADDPDGEQEGLREWYENMWGDQDGLANGGEHRWDKDEINADLETVTRKPGRAQWVLTFRDGRHNHMFPDLMLDDSD